MRALAALVLLAGCNVTFGLDEVKLADAPIDAYVPEHAVAYLPLDELSGPGTPDNAGALAACTNCPRPTTGKIDQAMEFTSTSQQFQLEKRANIETTSAYTVSFWYRLSAYPGTESCAVQKLYGTGGDNSWQFCVNAAHVSQYFVQGDSGTTTMTGPLVALDTWYHVALVWTGTVATLYIDGAVTSGQATTNVLFDGGAVTIGADSDNGTPILAPMGFIDDVRIYDVALPTAEIQALANP